MVNLPRHYQDALTNEVLVALAFAEKSAYGKFKTPSGRLEFTGATETDVIAHLTSRRDYVAGRTQSFPGIAHHTRFEPELEACGFVVVEAINYRGQRCRAVTLA